MQAKRKGYPARPWRSGISVRLLSGNAAILAEVKPEEIANVSTMIDLITSLAIARRLGRRPEPKGRCRSTSSPGRRSVRDRMRLGSWLVLAALSSVASAAMAQPSAPATAMAEAGTWAAERTAYGHSFPIRDVTLSAPFAATATTVEAEPGQHVQKGQVLAHLDAPALAGLIGKLQSARKASTLAEQRLAELRQREKQSLIIKDEVLQGEISVNSAHSAADEAWRALDEALVALGQRPDHEAIVGRLDGTSPDALAPTLAILQAPFAGIVTARPLTVGATLTSGTPLFRVEDLTQVYVEAGVPTEALKDWQRADAFVGAPAGPIALQPTDTAPSLDPGTGLWLLRYKAEHADNGLRGGEWLKVTLRGPSRSVVWVPEAAVVARNEKTYCIVQDGGAPRAVVVTVGPSENGRIPVLSGIEPGQQIVTKGGYELLYRDLNQLQKFVD
jgi:multidrug efflux pump subunit AcrA (membrane-fusion protein)